MLIGGKGAGRLERSLSAHYMQVRSLINQSYKIK